MKITAHLTVTSIAWWAVSAIEVTADRLVTVNFASNVVIKTRFEEALSIIDAESVVAVADVRMVARAKNWTVAGHVVPPTRRVLITHVSPGLSAT